MAEKFEVAIVGRGPAGLQAAIYTARAGVSTVLFGGRPKLWGEHKVDNYFGFPEGLTGEELLERGEAQARRFEAELRDELVLEVKWGEAFTLLTATSEVEAPCVLIATGIARRQGNVPGLDKFEGRGVSYCVSCDGFFFRGKPVAVLGERDHAAMKAIEVLSYTRDVTLCTDGREEAISPELRERLKAEGIKLRREKVAGLAGQEALTGVRFESGPELAAEGLFVALGEASSVDFARTLGLEMRGKFIVTDTHQRTNIPGIWAAGDCTGRYLQVACAVGDGAVASADIITRVRELRKGTLNKERP
jgi:thioredoxin reductase (NADPH)